MVKNGIFGVLLLVTSTVAVLSGLDAFWGFDFGYSSEDFYLSLGFIALGIIFYAITDRVHQFMFPRQRP